MGCGGDEVRGDVLIRAERLFGGERTIEPGSVLVRGDAIAAVGEELDTKAERTIDLGDATILPRFIDLHVHVRYGDQMARGGITTMRNVGSSLPYLSPPTRDGGVRILKEGPLGAPLGIVSAELRLMRDSGLTPEQVLAAGTSLAGRQTGLAPLGTLAEGALADVIAVRGDVRRLRDDLARPLLVVAGGRIVADRAD